MITVRGADLNYEPYQPIPPKSPAYSPSNQPDCPVKINGNAGRDYGTRLYFVDRSAKPQWSAGRYRPGIHELDCIGLIITRYTSGEVVFRFGAFFKRFGRIDESCAPAAQTSTIGKRSQAASLRGGCVPSRP